MLKHPDLTEERILKTIPRLFDLVYPERAPLEVAAFHIQGEPQPPAIAFKANYSPFRVGELWGPLWSTTWFRLRGEIPKTWKGREVLALVRLTDKGGEGFTAEGLVFQNQKPTRALNINRNDVPIAGKARGGEAFEFFVEAAANGGYGGDGTSDGKPVGIPLFPLAQAELAWIDREAYALYFDFKVAAEAMMALPPDSQRRADLRYTLNDAVNLFDPADRKTIAPVRAALKPILSRRNGGSSIHRVSGIGHAHIDTAWLWPLRETIRKCARTFSTALAYMEKYPEYVFGCSQALQIAWMEKLYPDIFEGIRRAVKRGQWEPIGSMWIEADCNVVSGESLIRQILHGKRYFREKLGVETRDCWIPDVFGYSAAMPQILAGCGIDLFVTQKISWNQFNKFPHHTFWWEGIDGTRIFSHFPPCDTYNAEINPPTLLHAARNFADKDRATRSIMPYGYGDGGGGPSLIMLEQARRLRDFEGIPALELESVASFSAKARAEAKDLATWTGELYLELHRGTYTTQAKNKRGNRKSEILLRKAEFLDAVTKVLAPARKESASQPAHAIYDVIEAPAGQSRAHRHALDRAWKLTLLNQFHDIIPGSSITWVYEDSARDYAAIAELAGSVVESSLATLESRIDTSAFSQPLLLVNPLGFARREVIELPGGGVCQVDVPSCGYAVIEANSSVPVESPVEARQTKAGIVLQNGLLRLRLNKKGHLSSIHDLAANREVLAPGSEGNVLQLHPDYPNRWDAWDIDVFYKECGEDLSALDSMTVTETGPLRAVVQIERTFGRSRLVQQLVLRAGSRRIDFVTEIDWLEEHRLLKVAFPVQVRSPRATYEIQFGQVERPTHYNTSWDLARFEVCAQRWADLSEPGYGVALLNDCKYGYDIHGNVMRLSLLRSSRSPDPGADTGRHAFTYSLLPHAGTVQDARIVQEAAALNEPIEVRSIEKHAGAHPPIREFFHITGSHAVIDTIKRAEDSDDLIVRIYEAYGARGPVEFSSTLPLASAHRCDLLEHPEDPLTLRGNAIQLDLRPFEITTLRLAPARAK